MDLVSLRGKRPREEPAAAGVSAAHGRSKARRACRDSVADAETWSTSGDEEYAKSEASEESECSGGEEDHLLSTCLSAHIIRSPLIARFLSECIQFL